MTSARLTRAARNTSTPVIALGTLLAVTMAWGSSYPLTKVLLQTLTARQFLSLRFAIGAVAMAIALPGAWRTVSRRTVARGIGLGLLFGSAQLLQKLGLLYTPAAISGFITGLAVVLTPLCAWFLFRTRIRGRVWAGVIVATVGLAVLALHGASLGFGEWVTLACALFFALQTVALSAWATARDAAGMAIVQLATIAAMCSIATIPDGFKVPSGAGHWVILLYLALIPGGVAIVAQTWAQSYVPATRAAVTMSTEPVWAAVLAIGFFGEPLTWRIVVGGVMMLAAMVIVETRRRRPPDLGRTAGSQTGTPEV